ncbi:DUF503 domain-containing protein [candidate division WOR-3 bacterium]|nr:DUF503 domain-containing protein [candidate division WOR-3 bacterium]
MCVGLVNFTLSIEWAYSLKDKRQAVRSVKERLKNKFNASVAETGDHDLFNRATLSAAVVGSDKSSVEPQIHTMIKYVENDKNVRLEGVSVEYL